MVFAHVCEQRVAAPLSRDDANAVANACFQRALTGTTPGTRRLNRESEIGDQSVFFRLTTSFRRKHAAKSVNHVSIIAINYISVRGLHFETIIGGPGAAAQYAPIAAACTVVAFISIKTPFPNVPAEIV
jgi:hypothetical protein